MEKKITVIPATEKHYVKTADGADHRKKVAGYARVSTDTEEQETSYETQKRYYTDYITGRSDWVFAGMYTDDGISATETKHREGFNQMIKDALDGKIDMIITKSVSRFARNTVDSLTTVRKLRDRGIGIYFEKENIDTLDSKGELLITIMSSLAQEESRSISENTAWGKRKSFAEGKVSLAYSHFLGYDKGPDGEFIINPEQAETVKRIYRLFLDGYSYAPICGILEQEGRKTPEGRTKWIDTTVKRILTNEKYKGDAMLQKSYTPDFLTRKAIKNNGVLPQYYVKGHHEAIISPGVWAQVQVEMKKRESLGCYYISRRIFDHRVFCGECGGVYGRKLWHSTDKSRKYVWQCNDKYAKKKYCSTPALSEESIKDAYVSALNKLLKNRDEVIENVTSVMKELEDTSAMERELKTRQKKLNELNAAMQEEFGRNTGTAGNRQEDNVRYIDLAEQFETAKAACSGIEDRIMEQKARAAEIGTFIKALRESGTLVKKFETGTWSSLAEKIIVYSKKDIRVVFKGGMEIKA